MTQVNRRCDHERDRGRGRVRRVVCSSTNDCSSSSDDNEPLSVMLSRLRKRKYVVGIKVRNKFGSKYFNDTIVRVDRVNGQYHVQYSDDDSENMSEHDIKNYIVE